MFDHVSIHPRVNIFGLYNYKELKLIWEYAPIDCMKGWMSLHT